MTGAHALCQRPSELPVMHECLSKDKLEVVHNEPRDWACRAACRAQRPHARAHPRAQVVEQATALLAGLEPPAGQQQQQQPASCTITLNAALCLIARCHSIQQQTQLAKPAHGISALEHQRMRALQSSRIVPADR